MDRPRTSNLEPRTSKRACPRAKRRGGQRPGAGAPKGNLNALCTGARSKQLKVLVIVLMAVPETRRVLLHLNRLEQKRRAELADAINHYAGLLKLPSRERSIKSIRRKGNQ